jgi:uncharacterized protein (TIRG00374 family)
MKQKQIQQEIAQIKQPKKLKKFWQSVIIVFINVAVIATILLMEVYGKENEILDKEIFRTWSANFEYLIYAALCGLGIIAFESIKYTFMLFATTKRIRPITGIKTAIIGKYYDFITPLGSGGQPFQMVYLAKDKRLPAGISTSIPLVGMILFQCAFFVFAVASFIVFDCIDTGGWTVPLTIRILAVIGAILNLLFPALILISMKNPNATKKLVAWFVNIGHKLRIIKNFEKTNAKINDSVDEYCGSMKLLSGDWPVLILGFVCGLGQTLSSCLISYFVVRAFGEVINPIVMVCLTMFAWSAVAFVPTPGNSGAAEAGFYAVFSTLSSPFWATMLWRFFGYYMILIIGLLVIIGTPIKRNIANRKRLINQQKEMQNQEETTAELKEDNAEQMAIDIR